MASEGNFIIVRTLDAGLEYLRVSKGKFVWSPSISQAYVFKGSSARATLLQLGEPGSYVQEIQGSNNSGH